MARNYLELEKELAASGDAPDPAPDYLTLERERFASEDAAKTQRLQLAFETSLTGPIDREASIVRLARDSKIPEDIVEAHHDDLLKAWQDSKFNAAAFRKSYPGLASLILDGTSGARVAQIAARDELLRRAERDLGSFDVATSSLDVLREVEAEGAAERAASPGPVELNPLEKIAQAFKGGFRGARQATEVSEVGFSEYLGDLAAVSRLSAAQQVGAFDVATSSGEVLQEIQAREEAERAELGFREYARDVRGADKADLEEKKAELRRRMRPLDKPEGLIEEAAQASGQFLGSIFEYAKGAGAGAIAGAPLGAPGVGGGALAGGILRGFQLGTGEIYNQLSEATTDDGEPIPAPVKVGAATFGGAAFSAIEAAQAGTLLRMAGPLGRPVRSLIARKAVEGLLRDRTAGGWRTRTLARIGKDVLIGSAVNTVQETAQEALIIGDVHLAKMMAAGGPQEFDLQAAAEQLAQTARTTLLGTLPLGLGAFGVRVPVQLGSIQLRQEEALRAGQRVATIAQIAKESPTARAAPEAVARLIERETADSGEPVTHLYIEAPELMRLFQENGADGPALDEAVTELLGENGSERLAQAIATGQRIEVPVAEYLEKWGSLPVAEALVKHTAVRPGGATLAEAERFHAEWQQEAERIAAENLPPESEAEASYIATLERQLGKSGVGTKKDATAPAILHRAFTRTMAAQFPAEARDSVFENARVTVERAQEGQAGAAAAQGTLEQGTIAQEAKGIRPRLLDPNQAIAATEVDSAPLAGITPSVPANEARALLRPLLERLQGFTYRNAHTGWEIQIGALGKKHALQFPTRENGYAITALPQLLERAVLVKSESQRRGEGEASDPNIRAVHIFYAPMRADGRNYRVRIIVRETNKGERFYHLHSTEAADIKMPGVVPGVGEGALAEIPESPGTPDSRAPMTLRTLLAGVKEAQGAFGDILLQGPSGARTETPEFKAWFRDSKVVDENGQPLRVFHGTKRPDRIGKVFRRSRATSGPMAFFTDSGAVASGYAQNKADTSLEAPDDYAGWFKLKVGRSKVNIDRAWWLLTPEQRTTLAERLPRISLDDATDKFVYTPDEYGYAGKEHWEWEIRNARGNVLRAAVETWLNSAGLFDQEERFVELLELAGLKGVEFDSPHAEFPSVIPVYLSIQKPLDTSAIPGEVVDALEKASRRQKAPKSDSGADPWDKRSRDPRGWMAALREDIEKGTTLAWTSIPDWVTKTLTKLGYDGIHDTGGKQGGETHTVWIPFRETQVKSATGNRGTFDPSDPNILHQTVPSQVTDPRGFVEFAREGARRIFRIVLNPNADLSTFLHESGHVFLEMMGDLAEREDAPERLRRDYATALQWLGVSSRSEIKREHHEKWARAFEAYLFEGRAPSAELVRPFERFKLWLRSIYRSLSSFNVEMSDDIRGVFDRMLATDAEIERTRRAMGLGPMFRSQEEAGMTSEQWESYLDEQEKAASHANRAVEFRVLKDRLREQESWWKEGLKEARAEAEAAYEGRKDFRAWRYIRLGEIRGEDGTLVQKVAVPKLDRTVVEEMLGPDRARRFTGAMVKKGGVHPDTVAELFGYETGQQMLEGVLAIPDRDAWVRGRADTLMRERHPEILDEREKLQGLVAQGLHGTHTSNWLLKEWTALRARSGQRGGPPVEAIRRAARLMSERQPVRILNSYRILQAERSAAEKAARAAAKGDYAQAYVFKQQQLLNHFLYRELEGARELRDQFEELASSLSKDKARARLGKADPAYRDGVDQILEALGLREPEQREAPPASIEQVVAAMDADGNTIGFEAEPIARLVAEPRDWRDLTVSELRNVYAALRNIRAAARNRNTVLVEGKRVDREETIARLLAEAESGAMTREHEVSSSTAAESMAEKALSLFAGIDGELIKPETMAGFLGVGTDSAWFRSIVLPLQQAKHREADLLKTTFRPLIEAFEAIPQNVRAHLHDKVDGKALFPEHTNRLAAPTRRFELLMLVLHYGTESSRQRLLDGRNITDAQVQAAVDLLTKEELDWVQAVWDAAESLWPLARELEERDSGLIPPKLEARPLVTRFGTYRGGYFPAAYDRRVEMVGERQAAESVAALFDPGYARPGTSHNYLKRRVENFAGVLSLDPGIIQAHLVQVVHDIAFREAVKSVGGLILDERIQGVINRRLGEGRAAVFHQWLKDVGRMHGAQAATHLSWINRILRGMKGNFVVAVLGWRLDIAAGDFSNLAVGATVVKRRYWAAGLAEFIAHPKKAIAFAQEKSGELRFRRDQLPRQFGQQVKKLTGRGPLKHGPMAWYIDHAFAFQEATDLVTSTPLWLGAYRQALDEGRTDAEAVVIAEAVIRKLLPTHSVVDQAAILRAKNEYMGMATAFYGYFSSIYSRYREIIQPILVAETGGDRTRAIARASGQMIALGLAYSVLADVLMGRGPSEEDGDDPVERWLKWMLRRVGMAPFYALPFPFIIGLVEQFAMGRRPSVRTAPAYASFEAITKAAWKAWRGEDNGEALREVLKALGMAAGVPTAPVRAIEAVAEEE